MHVYLGSIHRFAWDAGALTIIVCIFKSIFSIQLLPREYKEWSPIAAGYHTLLFTVTGRPVLSLRPSRLVSSSKHLHQL